MEGLNSIAAAPLERADQVPLGIELRDACLSGSTCVRKLGETNFHPPSIHSRLWGPGRQNAKYPDMQIPRPTHTWIQRCVRVPLVCAVCALHSLCMCSNLRPTDPGILGAECGEAGGFPEGNDVWASASRFFSLNGPVHLAAPGRYPRG